MAIIFNQVNLVSSGSTPLASDMISLANGINSRLKSGIADTTKRIHQYVFNLFRQFRNPDADGNFPSLGEWSTFYAHVTPETATYPVSEAGENEGCNLACPGNNFVFGNPQTDGEGDWLTTYTGEDFFNPPTNDPEGLWTMAKYQRGAYDPVTTAQNTPALEMAQRHFRFAYADHSRHHKTPGGYLPRPEQLNQECVSTDVNGNSIRWINYAYKWTNIADPSDVFIGTGTCGPDANGSESDILYVANYPFAWYVHLYDGTVYTFLKSEWVMTNDGGGVPGREDGEQITRLMVNPFVQDFRGTDDQRNSTCFTTPYIDYAFGNQDFFTSQYQLSPASASWNGFDLTTIYPSITINTAQPSGSITSTMPINDGFRLAGHLVKQRYLSSDVSMSLMSGSTVLHSFLVSTRSGSMVETFMQGPTNNSVYYRFNSTASFTDPAGYIYIEQSHLVDRYPGVWDAYAVIRLATAQGAISDDTMDTRGLDCETARTISNDYFNYGCIVNQRNAVSVDQQQAAINNNPVYDASRRYIQSFTRVINGTDMQLTSRPLLVGYEVSASKSILYFEKYQSAVGLMTQNINLFDGMLNTQDSASNGIVTTAPAQGYTNEWLLDICTKPYNPSISSVFKPDVYANYWPYLNRAHILPDDREINSFSINDELFRFFQDGGTSNGADQLYFPESLTAYNYDGNPPINKATYDVVGDDNYVSQSYFYKSCQVYPKPYELESVTAIAGNQIKVVLTTRLQSTDVAPSSVANDVASWNFNTVASEPYRTDENALRLFLLKMYSDGNNPPATFGDLALKSRYFGDVYAAIYPTFFFTKLIQKPYANDGVQSTGSLDYSGSLPRSYDLQLCETYVRAICEGFVDQTTSINNACNRDFAVDYDYTFSSLCFDAFSGSYINNLSASLRPDNPWTFGPLPDMNLTPTPFNQIAQCVNKLVKARLPLPWRLETNVTTYQDEAALTPTYGGECGEYGTTRAIQYAFTPPTATTVINETGWQDSGDSIQVGTALTYFCDGLNWKVKSTRTSAQMRLQVDDQIAWYAVNDDLRALVSGSTDYGGIFGYVEDYSQTVSVEPTLSPVDPSCGEITEFWKDPDTGYYYQGNLETTELNICQYIPVSTVVDAGQLGVTDIMIGFAPSIVGNTTCGVTPYGSKTISITNKQHIIITVPTV